MDSQAAATRVASSKRILILGSPGPVRQRSPSALVASWTWGDSSGCSFLETGLARYSAVSVADDRCFADPARFMDHGRYLRKQFGPADPGGREHHSDRKFAMDLPLASA